MLSRSSSQCPLIVQIAPRFCWNGLGAKPVTVDDADTSKILFVWAKYWQTLHELLRPASGVVDLFFTFTFTGLASQPHFTSSDSLNHGDISYDYGGHNNHHCNRNRWYGYHQDRDQRWDDFHRIGTGTTVINTEPSRVK